MNQDLAGALGVVLVLAVLWIADPWVNPRDYWRRR